MANVKVLTTCLLFLYSFVTSAQVYVRGYTRSNGTYVQPHYRSSPNSTLTDNYSYPGNVNPYTGKVATGSVDAYIRNHSNNSSETNDSNFYPSPEFLKKVEEDILRNSGQNNHTSSGTDWNNSFSTSGTPAFSVAEVNSIKSNTQIRKGPGKKFAVMHQTMFPEDIKLLDSYQNGWSKISFTYITRTFDFVQKVGYVPTNRVTSSMR